MARFTTELPSNSSVDCHESFWSLNLEELVKKRKELEDMVEKKLQRASASKAERIRRQLARANKKMKKDLNSEFEFSEMVKKGLENGDEDLWSLQGSFCPTNNAMDGQWTNGLNCGGWNILDWMNDQPMSDRFGFEDESSLVYEDGLIDDSSSMNDPKVVESKEETGAGTSLQLDLPLLQAQVSLEEKSRSREEKSFISLQGKLSISLNRDQEEDNGTLENMYEEIVIITYPLKWLSPSRIFRTLEGGLLVPNHIHETPSWIKNALGSINGSSQSVTCFRKLRSVSFVVDELYPHDFRRSWQALEQKKDHEEARQLECISGPPWFALEIWMIERLDMRQENGFSYLQNDIL